MIIDNRIQTKNEVMDFIQMQVDQRSGRPNMENAVAKWESDVRFLEGYRLGGKSVKVGSMRAKR